MTADPAGILIADVRVFDPARGADEARDLLIVSGRIAAEGERPPRGAVRIDGRGLAVAPGFWDLHVHFRDPPGTGAECLASGAAAAARGGFTRVVTMPNTVPACDTPEAVARQAEAALPVRILPSACLTRGREGREAADLAALAAAGACAFTDDGSTVADDAVMTEAMRRARAAGKPVLDHAVNPALLGIIRDGPLARRLGLPVMPPEAEVAAVKRDIALARATGCRLHLQHLSCAGSVDALRAAQREGLTVTAEATPHHLALSVEDTVADNGHFRMNPPLGNRDDVRALRAAVLDGGITALATDHAPHAAATQERGFRAAASGVIGLETAVGVTHAVLVEREGMDALAWVSRWTTGPARVLGLEPPDLRPGAPADCVLLDLATPWIVDPARFASRSRNCPFAGWTLHARPLLTFAAGRVAWRAPEIESRVREIHVRRST
jgi:dihydroorotase